ncbi:DUF2236 domain-containing protein [Fulvivirga sp. RKSG066]|uniref:oxygenase MpaB family protein n=1 Tax=Fulvivirga aurantia TaxID=2529383 RepID=UPI0012BD0242|nr:oxygenase MpaB family protein [Fulvivirga aurantia]MTI20480.1 DUF2236 domain-containing protein [Fulvivirga aurantia]
MSFDLDIITEDFLESLRTKTDPLADDTVNAIIESGHAKEVGRIFMTLMRNDSFKGESFNDFDEELQEILNQYFIASAKLPEWYDSALIKQGEAVFNAYGPEIFMLLNVSSLPMCYTCAKGAEVLYTTGRLVVHNNDIDPLARRLMETAQMIMNVMSEGGLSPDGAGVITMQKVRLIHASIRHYLKQQKDEWDTERLGQPINQEDLAGTLMSFGPVILSGLKNLNIELSESEQNAYMHCWKVVGHMMGIQEELLPDTYDQGFALATKILSHQAAPSQAGKELTASCIKFLSYVIPGNAFDDIPGYMMSYFLEDFSKSSGVDLISCIGVNSKEEKKDKVILAMTRYLIGQISHLEHISIIRKITPVFNRMLLQGMIYHFNGGKSVHFTIPPSLQKEWNLIDDWSDYKTITPNLLGNRLTWQKKTETIK